MRIKINAIYLIFSRIDKKKYVGSSNDVRERFWDHKYLLNSNKHRNTHLQRAWNKYKQNNFKFSIVERVPEEKNLQDREQFWMDKLKVCDDRYGYNICPRADHKIVAQETKDKIRASNTGKKASPESIAKRTQSRLNNDTQERKLRRSEVQKGKKLSEEAKENLRTKNIGKKLSEEHKKKIGQANKNKKLSDEHKKKISEANKGKKKIFSEEHKKNLSKSKNKCKN